MGIRIIIQAGHSGLQKRKDYEILSLKSWKHFLEPERNVLVKRFIDNCYLPVLFNDKFR
jgi:hypothetical protein